jgi:acyl carrier protein
MPQNVRTPEEIQTLIVDRITREFRRDPGTVTPATIFGDDLGADSLELVELVMAVEEEFGLQIPDEAEERFKTVGDVIDYVQQHVS